MGRGLQAMALIISAERSPDTGEERGRRKEGRKKRSLNLHSPLQKPFCTQPSSPG